MLRKYRLISKFPVSKIIKDDTCGGVYWNQELITSKHIDKVVNQIGFKNKPKCGIKHTAFCSIGMHRDRDSKSVFIIPVKVGKNTRFCLEDKFGAFRYYKLDLGFIYRFNDHDLHGLHVPDYGKNILITIEF